MERSEMFSATYTEIVPDTGRCLKLKLQINLTPRNGICILLAARGSRQVCARSAVKFFFFMRLVRVR